MKKLLLLMIMVIGGLSAFSQQPTATETAKHQTKQVQNPAAWACPACLKITKKAA